MSQEPWKIKCHVCGDTFLDGEAFAKHVKEEHRTGKRDANDNLAWVKQDWFKIPLLDMEADGN